MSSFDPMKEMEHDYEYREYLKSKNSHKPSGRGSGCATMILGLVFVLVGIIFALVR
jgi:hypothetical protein